MIKIERKLLIDQNNQKKKKEETQNGNNDNNKNNKCFIKTVNNHEKVIFVTISISACLANLDI